MLAKLREIWTRISVAFYLVLTIGAATALAAWRIFARGRAQGEAEATTSADKERVHEAAESGDSTRILREWRRTRKEIK